jgi:hypothetical protein
MKRNSLTIIILLLFSVGVAQQLPENNKPFVEVTGTSETEITPDEIYIVITLQERMENKEKLLIEKQEQDLKENLKDLGINLDNITLNNANADFRKIRMNKKDVINSKSYTLKVSSADMVGKVYERLDKINAYDAYISRLSHSRILEFNKENRIKAIKAAKEKVDYVLNAVGKQSGSPLQITETDNVVHNGLYGPNYRAANNAQIFSSIDRISNDVSEEIAIKKIKIVSSFLVKYEILNK